MKKHNLKWSTNNTKTKKLGTLTFGIPAFEARDGFKTCPKAGACAAICYARQGLYLTPGVQNAREHNLAHARGDLKVFVAEAIEDIKRFKNQTVRIHDSGDFFSQDYLNAWYEIARAFPEKTFYAYTKSLHLNLWDNKPDNFRLNQSEGGLLDSTIDKDKPHARIFKTHYARRKAGYGDGSHTDYLAITGKNKRIGLVYHGNKKLTDAQARHFS